MIMVAASNAANVANVARYFVVDKQCACSFNQIKFIPAGEKPF